MAPASWLKKVFVPENDQLNVGTPEDSHSLGDTPQPGPVDTPQAAGDANGAGTPANEDAENSGQPATQPNAENAPPIPPPEIQDKHEEYHYTAFDDEGETGLWNQHTRIVLAIGVVFLSALVMWWILI